MNLLLIQWYKIRKVSLTLITKFFALILWVEAPPLISVAAFIERDGKYLVLDLVYRNGYAFPGGLVNPHEDLETALRREVLEETTLTIDRMQFIASAQATQYFITDIVSGFEVTTTGSPVESVEGKLYWKTADEILARCAYPNSEKAFRKYLAQKTI